MRSIYIPCDPDLPLRMIELPLETSDEAMRKHFCGPLGEHCDVESLQFQTLFSKSDVHNVPWVPLLVTAPAEKPAKINVRASALAIAFSDGPDGVKVPRGDVLVVGRNNLPRDMRLQGETMYTAPPHGVYLFLVNAPGGNNLPLTTIAE